MEKLHEKLIELENSDYYPFHMPGHKRMTFHMKRDENLLENKANQIGDFSFYKRDITEIDGFDNMHHPEALLKYEKERAAVLFGSTKSYFLVNGSSCGILAAIMAVCHNSDLPVLMCRNAHASAYHAVELAGALVDYIYPNEIETYHMQGAIDVQDVAMHLQQQKYSAVFITSPTYEGILSDVEAIAKLAHSYDIPLIVDEAHGAHLGFFRGENFLPDGAVSCGADIVIESLHKTLPAMTQTAILHCNGSLVESGTIEHYLRIFQSSSPSYIMMDSMTSALTYCDTNRDSLLYSYREKLSDFYKKVNGLQHIHVLLPHDFSTIKKEWVFEHDPGKIIIYAENSGRTLYHVLREKYHLQMEMATRHYVIAMTSIMDSSEGFTRLYKALLEIDRGFQAVSNTYKSDKNKVSLDTSQVTHLDFPKVVSRMSIQEATKYATKIVSIEECENQICGDYIYQYPPDIPILVPGEEIFTGFRQYVSDLYNLGMEMKGVMKNASTNQFEITILDV